MTNLQKKTKKLLYLLDFQCKLKIIMDIYKSKLLNETQQDSEDSNYEGMILDIFTYSDITY